MKKYLLLILSITVTAAATGQSKNDRVVADNGKKFFYSDSAGLTPSYVRYFGDRFSVPDLKTIDGKTITALDLHNKTVIYNFWFVACKPCVAEIPALNKLKEKYQSDSTVFIAVTFDQEDRIQTFLQKHAFEFQLTSLPQDTIEKIKKVAFYPFTAIVNREGKISFILFSRPIGKNPEQEIFELLSRQLEKALHQ